MEQQAFVSPVALAQRRLWLVHQVEAERTLYNVASSSAIDGPLDAALLRRALAFVLDRHEALRTSFALMDGEPVQLVSPAAEAALPVVDLAAVPAGRRATEVRRIIAAEWARRFDLVWPEGNSLLRARLLRLGPAEHRLALVIHHIVSDGWSMGILRRELAAAYAAFARGEDPDLEELPIQYADFAEWQLERLGPEAEAEHVAFWRERLAGAPALLELPLDRPRGSRPASGGIHPVALPAGVTRRLTALAAAERTMPFAALAALTALLLHRHSGQDDLVLGWPAAGRDRPELEGLIGLFVNTLVLRVRFAPATSFRELLRAVGAELASGLAHQELPFDRLVEELSPERIPGANPLFQAMVVFQHAGEEPAPAEPGAARFRTEGTDLDLELAAGLFDLTLEMGLEEGALRGRFEYRADLFDRSTVARLADHLRHLAEDAVRRPDAPVERLDLHGAAERHALLVEWARPATGAREARERTFLEGWAAVAASRPEAAALEGPEGSTRHAELAERARRVARGLRRRGVGRGDVVALFFERSPEAVVAMLGVLEAGAAYLPLDPAYPEERRAFMLEDSGARLVLDGPELAELLAEPVPETTETLPAGPDPDDPAYLIYTSGSTGTPKGVQVCHRNLLFAARALAERYRIGATARLLQIAPLSFDASVAEIFPTLLAGGTLCFGRADDLLPGPALAELLRDRAVSHLTLVPSALAAMPEAAELPDLRILVVAGEACPAELAGRWRRGRTLINAYGPTEATICAAAGDVAAEGSAGSDRSSPPIGRPVTGSRVHVVDPEMNPAPVGVPGELVIGGRGVARGYRNRPRLTAERFVPDPWSDPAADPGGESAGARLYRSGDLAAWRPDGRLAFLGRVDRQVKVRGFRIEPGEIEAVLERHPDVHDSVVGAVVDPRRRGDDPAAPAVLAAWVVPRGGTAEAAVRPEELRRFLVARLPDHMVPTAYALLDSLPLTPAGKVDRRALPEPAGGASAPGAPAPPRTPVEELLVEIWADALGLDTLGVDQDFFSLGGHSLLATRVVGRVCKALEVDLPVSALFRAPTVAGLAERIAELGRWAPAGEALPPLEPVTGPIPETPEAPEGEETGARDGGRKLPLSFAQQRLWLLDRLEPGSPLYNVPMVFRISNLDRAALAGGVSDLVARHESLRTRFAERGDRPVQSIAPPPPPGSVPLPVVDLSALPEEPRRAEAWRLAAAEARRPFDLAARCREGLGEAAPGLLRTLLLTLEPDGEAAGHRLLATVHHAVFDGWSAGVFAEELAVLAGRRAEVGGGDGSAAPADLPPLPIQYGDYAVWQRRILSDRVVERELAFWRSELADLPESLPLPTDRPRPAVRSSRGGRCRRVLAPELAGALQALGRREGATLFMTLFAGFAALLGRWTGEDDLALGTPVAGRDRPELDRVIGFFVNTLVLRVGLTGPGSEAEGAGAGSETGFRALLGRVRARVLAAFAHQELPFDRLVEELRPERDRSRNPLVQVLFTLERPAPGGAGTPAGAPGPLTLLDEGPGTGTAKFDLTLTASVRPEVGPEPGPELGPEPGLELGLEYSADLFDGTTAARLLAHLERLLGSAVAAPERPLGALELLPAAERHQLLAEWGSRPAPAPAARELDALGGLPAGRVVHRVFGAWAEAAPDAVALVCGPRALTYGELDRRSRRLAAALRVRGVGPETPVGLSVERSPELIVAILGILRAGGAYLPLDPDYPRDRLAFMLEDSAVPVVVAAGAAAGRLPADPGTTRVVRLEALDLGGARPPVPLPAPRPDETEPEPDPDAPCYVMYTSGSTGRPKGTIVPHRGVVRLVRDPGYLRFGPDETVLHFAPISFDASTIEIWGALLNGGRLAIHPAGPASLVELAAGVEDRRATSVFLTTGLFHQLATREGAGELARLGAVRWLATGGDTASPEVCRRVLGALPGTVLGNAYGPTENSSVTTAHVMASATGVAEPVPIGRPIPDTTVHVVDPELRPAPVGVPGELVTGGAGLARGYLGRPALTAERFVPDPFAPAAGSRLYRTGDLVRWLPEGRIEFLGRIDHQVKVRGFRIEPGEVEAVLARHPAVAEAVVLARPAPDGGPGGGKALVAYAVAAPGAAPEPAELRGHLAARLPGFMVPAAVVVLPELPLTPSGKIDRRALPEPDWAGAGGLRSGRGDGGAAPPRTPVEEVIAGVWAEVLGGPVPADLAAEAPGDEAPAIGREDDFFAAGGHSLAAARVVARMRDALGVELPLARLFETPTVAGLAEAVERELSGGAGAAAIPPVRPIGPADASYAPMSFAQERLWFLDRLEPDAPTYNLPAIYRLSGGLDVAALARSLRRIVARHEALRTRFEDGGDAPRQVIAPADGPRSRLPLPVVDLSALPEPARRREAALRTARECRRPFDLGSGASGGSLLRAHLLRLTPPGAHAEHRLLLVFHHIVSDGWSIGVFERELSALYGVFRGIDPASDPLPPLPVQYVDFARWQREWLRGEVLDAQLAHWTGRLGDAPAVELPADRPRPARPTYRGRLLPIAYPPATARGLEALGRREGATGFMTLLAGFAALISRWTGHDDLVVGAPVANRRRAELEGLIGFFVNTLALRIDLSGPSPSDASPPDGLTFRGLLGRVRRTAIESYVHQDLPFERLVEALGIERDPSRNPLFQVMLSVEPGGEREALRTFGGGGGSEPGRPALEIAPEPVDAGISKFDLTLFALAGGGELSATAEYAADLFDGATVRRLLDHLGTLLAAAVADPDVPVADLPLVSAGERHQVLVEWGGPSPLPGRQAERPGSGSTDRAGLGAACIHERFFARAERTPDAEALVAGAERLTYRELARRARAVAGSLGGLAPEARVGICAERTADLVAALLGTLAAGGVYVPLDPDYPRRRLEGMLADSGAVALLADGPHRELAGSLAAAVGASGPAPAVLSLEEAVAGTDAAPIPKLEPGRLAYLIYTSGSTGRPKGVAIEHRAASALIDWSRRAFSDEELAGVAAVTSISFDLSVFELFVPLARGGRVILAADALALPDLPAAGEVTLLNTVPSSAAELERAGKIPPAAATINLAGEPLTRDLVDRLHALPGVRRVLNLYGPSEDTTYSTWTEVAGTEVGRAGPDSGDRQPTIGRAVAGTASRVVDRSLRPVPIGVPGELLLGGAGLARGYLGRPALTAERWVPAPGGARLYRTGDLVRRLPDGRLDFLGRIDHQVKVRGFRIELGEVEAALAALPEVAEAAAGVRGTEAADRRLVAWVVPSALGAADPVDPAGLADALRRALKERLPSSMIPSAFVVLEALPRTPSGKVDRKALPEPDPGKSHGIRGATAPRTPLESALAGIFAELLGVPFPGIEDDFFALGGHSLLAMRAISRVREAFGVEIPLRRLFEEPTVAALGRAVEAALIEIETGRGAVPLPPVEPVPRAAAGPTRLPLSAGQEQLWFVDRLEPGDPSFNLPSVARLRGALVPAALGRALAALVTRHEVLRTAFETGADGPSQVILPPDPPTRPPLPLIDVSGLPPERREPEARRWAAAEGRGAFDLGRAPLLRASLVRLAPEEHLFLLTVHHIVSDGRSQEILLADLEVLYDAARAAPAGDRLGLADAGLPAQALQYADYAVWQRRVLRGEALDRRLAYWRGRLGGTLPELRFPGEGAGRPAARSGRARRGEVRMLPLEGRLLERLRSLARAGGGTLFMTLLAAFAAWLHRVTGATDLLVGTPSANRGRTEVEDLVGFFVNTLVLRTDLTGDPGFLELAGRVREEALGAFTHADLPFESLVAALQPERSSGRAPLFRVLFALNPVRGGDERTFADLTYEPVVEHNGTSQFDLSLYAADRGGDVLLFAEYDAALFGPGAGDRILDQVRALLDEVAGAPERRLSELARGAALEPVRPAGPPEPAAGAATTEASETGKPAGTARATDPARRDRLAARRGRLSPEQRAALARRLRGAAERGPGGSDGTAGALPGTVPGTVPAVGAAGPSLVPLQPAGDAPPLFLVHPAGGDVLCFAPLAEQLALLEGAGRRRPVYGVQSRGLVDGFEPHAGIEEMAAGYLEEIGRLVPSGPVHLAGWSLGGVVAFEMARRARADAASGAAPDVALLAVLDTVPDVGELLAANASADGEDDDARWLMHIVEYAEGLSGRRLGLRHETLAGLPLEAQLARLGGALQATGLLPAPTGSTGSTGSAGSTGGAVRYLARLLDVFKANCRAVAGYRPGIYPGPITLFRTGSDPDPVSGSGPEPDGTRGWSAHSPEPVAVETVPGDHITLLAEPHVRVLARRLHERLRRADDRPRTSATVLMED